MQNNHPSGQRHPRGLSLLFAGCLALLGTASHTPAQAQGIDDPVLHWLLDDVTGFIASDSSGNGHIGFLEGYLGDDSQWVAGRTDGALRMAGGQYVAVSGLPVMTSTTWAAWVRATTAPNFSGVISATFDGVGSGAGHSLGFHTGATAFYPRIVWNHNITPTILIAPGPVAANEWHHLALTYDADTTTLRLYVDGELADESTSATTTPFSSLNVGRREATGANPLTGDVDDVRIYDRALPLEAIQELAGRIVSGPPIFSTQPESRSVVWGSDVEFVSLAQGLEPITYQWYREESPLFEQTDARLSLSAVTEADAGTYYVVATNPEGEESSAEVVLEVLPIDIDQGLQAVWTFDEVSGFSAADSGPHGNNGILFDFPDPDSHWIDGRVDGALRFNGANYVEVPDHPSIGADLINGFTVASWFRSRTLLAATGGGRNSRMLEKGDAYFFLQNPGTGGMNFLVKHNTVNYTASIGVPIEAEQWHHLAGTFDGTHIRVYLDGELRDTVLVGGPIDDVHLPLRIGSDDAGLFFNGDMDDVRIWNRALNSREIQNVMGRNLPEPPSFIAQPQDATVYPGSTVRMTADVVGQEPFRFLWYQGETELREATERTLVLRDVSAEDAGEYRVEVTNDLGTTFSSTAVLTIIPVEHITDGMAAFWRFDEESGMVASDSSENGLDGQLVDFMDSTQWVEGQVGGALAFDGLQSRVVVDNSQDLDLTGKDISIAFWVRPESYGTEISAGTYDLNMGRILRKGGHLDLYLVDDPGSVRRTFVFNGVNPPQNSVALGEWQHFAIVIKDGQAQFYRDGFPLGGLLNIPLGSPTTVPLVIGNFDEGIETPRFYHGALDELGIWNRPLSDSEVLELAGRDVSGPPVIVLAPESLARLEGGTAQFLTVATGQRPVSYQWFFNGEPIPGAVNSQLILLNLTAADAGLYTVEVTNELGSAMSDPFELAVEPLDDITSGLVGYWNFDETGGTTINDSSGWENHGTLINSTVSPGVSGQIDGALDFDGVGAFVVVPHHRSLDLTDQGTISVWINPRSHAVVGGHGRIVRKFENYDLTLISESGGTLRLFGLNKAAYDAPAGSVDLNVWQHVAVVVDRGTIQYYKNGVPLGTIIQGFFDQPNLGNLIIGNFQEDLEINRIYNGLMDDLGIWARALTPGDIDGIYQNGLLGRPLTAIFEPLAIRRLELGDPGANGDVSMEIVFFTPYSDRDYEVHWRESLADEDWEVVDNVTLTAMDDNHVRAAFTGSASTAGFFRLSALAPPPLFFDDFESGAPGWSHGGNGDMWELGTPTTGPGSARSGQNVYATGLNANYGPFSDMFLRTPVIDLTGVTRATLNFWEWRQVDPNPIFHGTVVSILDADTLQPVQELSRLAGSTAGWEERSLPLGSNSLNRRIVVEFRLYSDQFELREGWFLDDVMIHTQ